MKLYVQNSPRLVGAVTPPGSKSHSIRALMIALMASGDSILENLLDSEDIQAAKAVCHSLGCRTTVDAARLSVNSMGLPISSTATKIYSGNSGITTLFALPILGLRKDVAKSIILDCGDQMRARPIGSLVDALRQLGMDVRYMNDEGVLPLQVSGTLRGGEASVEGTTSQYISALLLALPCADGDSTISVTNLYERSYMEMTLHWLRRQNIKLKHQRAGNTDCFTIPGRQAYHGFQQVIPADFSSASYPIAAAVLLDGEVTLRGLDLSDTQGDKRFLEILQEMGADITVSGEEIHVRGGRPLDGIDIDANDIPDLLPTLAVVATRAKGKTRIYNVGHARIKETDRIHSVSEGLKRMGADIEEHTDGLTVQQSKLHGASVCGYDDHRTVMAFAIAGLCADGETVIDSAAAIGKTYPHFVTDMTLLGANIQVRA